MKRIIVLVVLAILSIVSVVVDAHAINVSMNVKVIQISNDHDGGKVVVVVNEDGDSFMFDQVPFNLKVGQVVSMCMKLTYSKGNVWVMEEGDNNIYLEVKNTKGGK